MRKIMIALLVLAALVLAASGCNQTRGTKYIISFNSNGGSEVDNIILNAGDPLPEPVEPVREGYVFIGWFYDIDCTRPVMVERFRATSNMTLFAGWESVETYPHSITVATTFGGSVTVVFPEEVSAASMGTEVKLNVLPLSGYECVSVTAVGATSQITAEGSGRVYTFIMPAEPVTIYAEFDYQSNPVTIASAENGTVILSQDSARFGDNVGVSFIPDYGYRSMGGVVTYFSGTAQQIPIVDGTFVMPNTAVSVHALFEPIDYSVQYDITAVESEGGEVILGTTSAAAGEYVYYYIVPEEGYLLNSVNLSSGGSSEQTFGGFFVMPEGDVEISASFVPDDFVNIDRFELEFQDSNGKGTVSVASDKTSFSAGEKVVLDVVPAEGYIAQGVVVNGTYFEKIGDELYFFMPVGKAFVSVDFRFLGYKITFDAENASVEVPSLACEADVVPFSVVPEKEGYAYSVKAISGDEELEVVEKGIYEYAFDMPPSDVEIIVEAVSSEKYSINVSMEGDEGGKVDVSDCAMSGEIVKIELSAEDGYRIKEFSVTANGAELNLYDGAFVMPEAEVAVSVEFKPVFYINHFENEHLSVTPSEYFVFEGDKVEFFVDTHDEKIDPYTVSFSVLRSNGEPLFGEAIQFSREGVSCTMPTPSVPGETVSVINPVYGNISGAETFKLSLSSTEGGNIFSNYRFGVRVPKNSEVALTILPDEGYVLKSLNFRNLLTGEILPPSVLFRMPQFDLEIVAEFERQSSDNPTTPEELFKQRKQEFLAAGFEISLAHSATELSGEWQGYTLSGYLNGAITVRSEDAFDFYFLYVDSLIAVAPVSQTAGKLLEKAFPDSELDCFIYFNTIVFALDGDAEAAYKMLRYGVLSDENFIYYRMGDGSLGVLSYIGESQFVAVPDFVDNSKVTYINRYAFSHKNFIRTISLGAVETVGDFAFEGVTDVAYFDIGFAHELGTGAFKGTHVTGFSVASTNGYFMVDEYGVLYRIIAPGVHSLEAYPAESSMTAYTLKVGTQSIADYAFYGAQNLETVRYMLSLNKIGKGAFQNASALERIIHSQDSLGVNDKEADFSGSVCNVQKVGDNAFEGTLIEKFLFETVTELGSDVICFDGSRNISVTLNDSALIVCDGSPVNITATDSDCTLEIDGGILTEEYLSEPAFNALSDYFKREK